MDRSRFAASPCPPPPMYNTIGFASCTGVTISLFGVPDEETPGERILTSSSDHHHHHYQETRATLLGIISLFL